MGRARGAHAVRRRGELARVASIGCFGLAAWRYWTQVYPSVCRELGFWAQRASAIADPELRALAQRALANRGNMEGAAAFAAFAPRRTSPLVTRAAVAFQVAYNHLDELAEEPSEDPVRRGRCLHAALRAALDPDAAQADYYEHSRYDGDGGYLQALVDRCQTSLLSLPSVRLAAPAARRAVERVIEFQSLNLTERNGDHALLEQWSRTLASGESELRWWEIAASAGSSLGVHAMIAAAAETTLDESQARALERAYFPSVGALHSLLDSVVDVAEDARIGQRSLLGYYASGEEAVARTRRLAQRSRQQVDALPHGLRHLVVLAGMTGMYLSTPEASAPGMAALRRGVLVEVGPLARLAVLVFKMRRAVAIFGRIDA